jgi:hypothetical protein
MRALADIGAAAVPAIVEAYLARNNSENREFLLMYSLQVGGLQQPARQHVLKIYNDHPDRRARMKLAELLKYLAETE